MSHEATEPPFATVEDLEDRWPDIPDFDERYLKVTLEDASYFILDVVPTAKYAPRQTLTRVTCTIVRRYLETQGEMTGYTSYTTVTGPFSDTARPTNPNGGFYLTKLDRQVLSNGTSRLYSIQFSGGDDNPVRHQPWCSWNFGAKYCSCGAWLTQGKPLWEH